MGSFRETPKSKAIIKETMKRKDVKNRSHAINLLIETHGQIEIQQAPRGKEEFFDLPVSLYCPIFKSWVLAGDLLNPKGCHDCLEKKVCPAWKRRIGFPFKLPTSKSRTYREAHTVKY